MFVAPIDMVNVNVLYFGIFTDMFNEFFFDIFCKIGTPVFCGPNCMNIDFNIRHYFVDFKRAKALHYLCFAFIITAIY
jgi:hypothetical protein